MIIYRFILMCACVSLSKCQDESGPNVVIKTGSSSDVLPRIPGLSIIGGILNGIFNRPRDPLVLSEWPGEACNRPCRRGAQPRSCYFEFVLEHYHAMGPACGNCANGTRADCFHPQCVAADGVPKGVMSINRKIPGPAIHVCHNDQIIVDVTNAMAGTATTIHWHGFHMRETPYMDGVPFITQCPIPFSNKFRYSFRASEPGTQFYHSHSGHHKVNGHYGGIVVRQDPVLEPNSNLYDFDLPAHLIVLSDWMHDVAETLVPGLSGRSILPDNLLINGRGIFIRPGQRTNTPLEVFQVKRGARFRFRFVNSASHVCPIVLQIEGHGMMIIASDAYPVQSQPIDTLVSTSGERYDFVVNANQSVGNYWIRIRAIGPCSARQIEQVAILRYAPNLNNGENYPTNRPLPLYSSPIPMGISLNHPNTTCYDADDPSLCIVDLHSSILNNEVFTGKPDHQFILAFDNHIADNNWIYSNNTYVHTMNVGDRLNFIGAVNRISFEFPSFSMLTQPQEVNTDMFCDESNLPLRCKGLEICPCLHVIKIPLNSLVELVIVDETSEITTINHPFHLHGHTLVVLDMGQGPNGIPMNRNLAKSMLSAMPLSSSQTNFMPPFKDTVSIPSRGFTVVRFRANNPGFWLMHCHFEWHMSVGMGLVLQVGEISDMVKAPENFPTCGHYTPDEYRRRTVIY